MRLICISLITPQVGASLQQFIHQLYFICYEDLVLGQRQTSFYCEGEKKKMLAEVELFPQGYTVIKRVKLGGNPVQGF